MTMPKTTLAAILTELRVPLIIDEIELPESLAAGQVMVEIRYSGICGSQLGEIDGAKGEDKYLPHLLGHEGSGHVLAIGPGVRHVAVGDTVVLHWRKGLGIESETPRYRWRGKPVNAGWVTTFNRHAVVSENRLTRIPAESDLKVAALYGCAITTGFGVVVNNAKLKIGESIVVYGAGGIGLNIVQAAHMVSANPVIAVDLQTRPGPTHGRHPSDQRRQARCRRRDPPHRRQYRRGRLRGQHRPAGRDRTGLHAVQAAGPAGAGRRAEGGPDQPAVHPAHPFWQDPGRLPRRRGRAA
jgi:hypothetical protein